MISVNNKIRRAEDCRAVCLPAGCDSYPALVKMFGTEQRHYYESETELSEIIKKLRKEGIHSKEALLIKNFDGRLFQMCPGSPGMICCNYRLINTGFNCLYDCAYCYLQLYLNSWGIVLFSNMEKVEKEISTGMEHLKDRVIRIGTGEFTDSLMWDEHTGISERLIEVCSTYPKLFFELKTKSGNIDHLLNIRDKGNSVIGFSLSTADLAREYEHGAAGVEERIEAAGRVVEAGYLVAFHFDPIIKTEEWRKDYSGIFELLGNSVDFRKVPWISMGTFRYAQQFKQIMRKNFPEERLTLDEFVCGLDGKYRYPYYIRREIYSFFRDSLRKIGGNPYLYMCMENSSMWQDVFDRDFSNSEDLEEDFALHLERFFL